MWWALFLGTGLLFLGTAGVVAAVTHFEPNIASLSFRNTDKEPVTFEIRITGVALFCSLCIFLCLLLAFRFLSRISVLQDREMRWRYLQHRLDELPAEEVRRLLEDEIQREAKTGNLRRPYQLRLVWPFRSLGESAASRGASPTDLAKP